MNDAVDRHLGRTADGTARPAYITPDEIDPTLLVAIPRSENRVKYGINDSDFFGHDRWNCYEFSTLLRTGFPLFGHVQILYQSSTPAIVESKSLKLYLNSFNMYRWLTMDVHALADDCVRQIETDLIKIGIPARVMVTFDVAPDWRRPVPMFKSKYTNLERMVLRDYGTKSLFDETDEPTKLLRAAKAPRLQRLTCAVRSNCKVTNQPDWGRVYVALRPDNYLGVDNLSLFRFIAAMRTHNHFHEEVCEIIYKTINDLVKPRDLLVACNYLRRGGIDINPVRASGGEFLLNETRSPNTYHIKPDTGQ